MFLDDSNLVLSIALFLFVYPIYLFKKNPTHLECKLQMTS